MSLLSFNAIINNNNYIYYQEEQWTIIILNFHSKESLQILKDTFG
jgi:hypothetical protein